MRLSLFNDVFDAAPKTRDLSWQEFCDELTKAAARQTPDKEHSPCFSPAEYFQGTTRAKKHVLRLHLAVLDIDAIAKADLLALLDTLTPYERAIYTTLSHSKKQRANKWALRVILPLKEPVTANDWPAFWQALDAMTGHVADKQCKDPSRLYLMPAHYPGDDTPALDFDHGASLDPYHLLNTPSQTADVAPQSILTPTQGQRVDLDSLRNRARNLARHKDEPAKLALAANLRALAKGQPYGEPGKRNATMLTLTCELDRMFPAASPDAIAAVFGPSHEAMLKSDEAEPDSIELVARAVEGARAMRQERQKRLQDEAERDLAQRIRDARGDDQDFAYTPAELDQITAMHELDPFELKQHWILRAGNRVHFLTLKGYTQGFSQQGIMPVIARYLSPVPNLRLRAFATPNSTERRFRAFDEVMADYGTDIDHAVFDLRASYSRYDPHHKKLVIASAPRAPLEAKEHVDVHQWLTSLGGDKSERFLQWVACVPDMEKSICAVYLNGAPGVGKTLFANGLARIWRAGIPTSFSRAVAHFNMELTACPLVFADEGFPALPPRQLAIELRNLVGSDAVQVEQKFAGTYPLIGPRRLILAANNASMLDFKSELSQNDIEALAVRIMQVEPNITARDIFRELSPQEFRDWQTHKIAEHALWLQQTKQVEHQPGNRFAVQGEVDEMIRHVIVDSYYPSLACQVIIKYLTDSKRRVQKPDGFIRWGNGQLLVNQHGLEAAWDELLPRGPRPPARMASVLRSLSQGSRSVSVRVHGMVRRYWEINLKVLFQWCEENGYVADEICAIIAKQPENHIRESETGLRVIGAH